MKMLTNLGTLYAGISPARAAALLRGPRTPGPRPRVRVEVGSTGLTGAVRDCPPVESAVIQHIAHLLDQGQDVIISCPHAGRRRSSGCMPRTGECPCAHLAVLVQQQLDHEHFPVSQQDQHRSFRSGSRG